MSIDNRETSKVSTFNQDKCQRNIRIFQIVGIDITILIVPVIVLLWIETGLAFHEMLLLQGLFVVPTLILEIPSGSFADYWSRKGCSTIHHLLFGFAMFLYAIGTNFNMFAIAEILAGVAVAFQTGSDTALVYDSLLFLEEKKKGNIEKFGKLVSQRMTIMFIGASLGALVGAFIAEISMIRVPIFITSLGHIILTCIVYLGYTEPPRMKAETPKAAVTKTMKMIRDLNPLKAILVFSFTGMVFGRIAFWAVQHILVEQYMVSVMGIGFILSGFNACAAVSSIIIRSRINRFSNMIGFTIILIIDGIFLFTLIQIPGLVAILLISLVGQVTRGIRTPMIHSYIQQYLTSDVRATFISVISFTSSVLYLILSVFIDNYKITREDTLILSFGGMLVISLIFLGFFLQNRWKMNSFHIAKT
ncbi:MAG: MFS transporter [Candidatus Hodarchaeales archaeon]